MIELDTTFKGIFTKTSSSFGFANINRIGKYSLEEFNKLNETNIKPFKIYISKYDQDYAVNNCDVIVKIFNTPENREILQRIYDGKYDNNEKKSLEGYVTNVILNDKVKIVGCFEDNETFGFVVPDDKSLPDIFIPKKYIFNAQDDDKVVVQIIKKPTDNQKLEGKIVEVLGSMYQMGMDILSIIKQAQIPYEFPEDVLEQAQSIEQEVSRENLGNRKIFDEGFICTIDGDDTKDVDDAISIKKLENGNYRLGVHIADVSNYVKNDSPLDKEAVKRGTSVYLLDRVIPMLPFELSNGICSLNEGVDRFALSCVMEIDKDGEVVDSEVFKSLINVTKKMTYKKVQAILDGDKKVRKEYKPYLKDFELMAELAEILKEKRQKEGYLNLDIPETKVVLGEDGKVIDVCKYKTTFANEIIEQFMLSANETIAEKFYFLDAPFIYRCHAKPDYDKIVEANRLLKSLNLKIKATPDKIYPLEFEKVLAKTKGTDEEQLVSKIVLQTLKNAVYEDKNEGHFGIGSKYYCHFTSPIRRYPDLFIHRIISYYLDNNYYLAEDKYDEFKEEAYERANSSTTAEKTAATLERQATKIKCCEYMSTKLYHTFDGIIISIHAFGMFVQLNNSVEGLIRFDDLEDGFYGFDSDRAQAINLENGRCMRIGDRVKVRVERSNVELQQIDFHLIEDYSNGYSDSDMGF